MDKIKILVVDDESRMRKLVKDFLGREGYQVLEAGDGMEAMEVFYDEKDIALIILDVMMPRMDGWQVCREVRQSSKVPIIMLTARSEERDELQGFALGVDEYISKPFSPKILVARVNAILRRANVLGGGDEIDAGGIVIDKAAHQVKIDGKEIELSFKEFELLSYFVENQGIALSREKILNNVWDYDYFGDARTIDTHVKKLRSKLVGLLICLVVTLMFINGKFLEPYYISKKESRFIELYEKLNDVSNEDKWDSTKKNNSLIHFAEKNNISYLVIEKDNDVHTNVHDKNMLKNQMMGYFLNQAQKESRTLDSTDVYQINQSWDPWNQSYYVDMWGSLDDGSQFLLRSPVESMRESASISNRFLLYIGSVLIVVSILLIWYFSKRITDPIRELARLSDRMADLDFDAKYTSGGSNEIGELGENFNRMSEKLESTISELKKANNSLQKDIEQKDKLEKMRNEFLGNVSHELKTPIALIQGYAEGLKEGVNEDAESREFYCDVIMDEASKMNQMVKNLLTLNQLEFGDEDIVFERFNLTALVKGVLQSMEIMADQAGAKIMLHTEEDIYAWADEFKVEQVVRNYVSNACHHVSGDMVIEVKMVQKDGKVRVSVFNTGNPIPEADAPHIWDKFYKVDKAHTREYGGNGIGLSIVKAIMKSFNQEYGVKNYDNGVEFWFELDVQ